MTDFIRNKDRCDINGPYINGKTGAASAGKKGRTVCSFAIIILMSAGRAFYLRPGIAAIHCTAWKGRANEHIESQYETQIFHEGKDT
jgi:hypothetical protein